MAVAAGLRRVASGKQDVGGQTVDRHRGPGVRPDVGHAGERV